MNQETSQQIPQSKINKIIISLVKEIEDLKKQIDEIQNNKLIDNLRFSDGYSEKNIIIPHRLKSDKGWRSLSESEIIHAQSCTETASEAAKYLGITYKTYRKWCVVYNKLKINPWGKGSKKQRWIPNKGKYPLNQILEGKFPNYSIHRLKSLLIRSGTKKAECEICGFNERRITDNKIPLLINFIDGDEKNYRIENLQILCYSHYFLQGRGYIRRGKVEFDF